MIKKNILRAAALKCNALRLKLEAQKSTKGVSGDKSPAKGEKRFKSGWREVGGKKIFARSAWEANFARYLQLLKEQSKILDWQHEPETFWFEGIKRGVCSYLPDFKVINLDQSHHWVEVKGYMDSRSQTKIRRFRKYFPSEQLLIAGKSWYKDNSKKFANIISDWE